MPNKVGKSYGDCVYGPLLEYRYHNAEIKSAAGGTLKPLEGEEVIKVTLLARRPTRSKTETNEV